MENEIISMKPGFERNVTRHTKQVIYLQQLVERLKEYGLTATFGDIKDLINNGSALYEQAEQTVKSNAGMFKLPAAKDKFIQENTEVLRNVIDGAKKEINRILAVDSMNPLSIDAFEIKKGIVSISETWVEQLKEQHTIRMTPEREKALELIQNVEVAIKELNDFVKDNRYFGAGIKVPGDGKRCLMLLSDDGKISVQTNELEFV